MKSEKLEVNTGAEMFPAILCAKTRISTNSNLSWPPKLSRRLTGEGLTVRGAHSRTGIAANDFSRIRNADLGRFTIDRLVSIVNRLGARVEVKVRVRRSAELGRFARPLSLSK